MIDNKSASICAPFKRKKNCKGEKMILSFFVSEEHLEAPKIILTRGNYYDKKTNKIKFLDDQCCG